MLNMLRFVKAGGYQQSALWEEATEAGYWQNGAFKGRFDNEWRTAPMDFGEKFMQPNQPVVVFPGMKGLAFLPVVEQGMAKKHLLPAGWNVSLPSEAEWEKAARGGMLIPVNQSSWAFGKLKEILKLESRRLIIHNQPGVIPGGMNLMQKKPIPVKARSVLPALWAVFRAVVSPYGVMDLCGNVWEWTRSTNKKYPYKAQRRARGDNS